MIVNITEGLKYHLRITFFIVKTPHLFRWRHYEKASKVGRKKKKNKVAISPSIDCTQVYQYIILSLFGKSGNTLLW